MEDKLRQEPETIDAPSAVSAPVAAIAAETQNDSTAPLGSAPTLTPRQWQFLSRVVPGAIESERAFTIPACVTIAQSILESATSAGWGTSSLFRLANNPFGIKYEHFGEPSRSAASVAPGAPSVSAGSHSETAAGASPDSAGRPPDSYGHFDAETWEIVNGHKEEIFAQFQRFPNLTTAFLAHAQLLCSTRYHQAFAARSDWKQFAERLGPQINPQDRLHCGYSTNPEYAATLISLVDRFHLDDSFVLARLAAISAEPPSPAPHGPAESLMNSARMAADTSSRSGFESVNA